MNSNKSKLDKKEWLYLKELNGVQHHFFGSRVGFRLSKKTATE